MAVRLVNVVLSLSLLLLPPRWVLAQQTLVQKVPCESGRELRLARDGTVSACRLAEAAELLVGPDGGNAKVACVAGSSVEFHRNGYLSFCDEAGAGRVYVTRSRQPSACRPNSRVAFDEHGYLEYCS